MSRIKFPGYLLAYTIIFGSAITGCNKHDIEPNTNNPGAQEPEPIIPTYDSIYDASYNLYIVNDDTPNYSPHAPNTPLTKEEEMIGHTLNEYATEMLSEYDTEGDENIVVSPLSATMLYAMMANFVDESKGENAFKEGMGIEASNNEDVNTYFHKYIDMQKEKDVYQNEVDNGISVDNHLWMDKNSSIYNSFLSTAKSYGFGVKGMDISDESTIETINDAISSQMGSNDATLKSSANNGATSMITSTITFKNEWETKFYVDSTQNNLFTNFNGSTTTCKLLHATRKDRYYKFLYFNMMEIPYKGFKYSMYIALPHDGVKLSQVLTELNNKGINQCMEMVSDTTRSYHGEYLINRDSVTSHGTYAVVDTLISDTVFNVSIPIFKLCSAMGLNPNSTKGISATKSMYKTNMTKVSPNGFKLGNVFQACDFEINENGTSASSSGSIPNVWTGVGVTPHVNEQKSIVVVDGNSTDFEVPKGRKIQEKVKVPFCVLHPFIVFIRDNKCGTIPFACSIKRLDANF